MPGGRDQPITPRWPQALKSWKVTVAAQYMERTCRDSRLAKAVIPGAGEDDR